jgi:glucosylceramidase
MIENLNYGGGATVYWNLVLDPNHGPKNQGCQNCRGLLTLDPATGHLEPSPEYYYLTQASRVMDRGAKRIGAATTSGGMKRVAVSNPDSSFGVVALNTDQSQKALEVHGPKGCFTVKVEPRSAISLRW